MSDSARFDADSYNGNDYGNQNDDWRPRFNGKQKPPRPKRQAFEVEDYIVVRLDPDLAFALAEHILNTAGDNVNAAVMALAKRLEEQTR